MMLRCVTPLYVLFFVQQALSISGMFNTQCSMLNTQGFTSQGPEMAGIYFIKRKCCQIFSTFPFTSTLITVATGSSAVSGTLISMPSLSDLAFNSFPLANSLAEVISFLTPGTNSFPSFGQSNTEK